MDSALLYLSSPFFAISIMFACEISTPHLWSNALDAPDRLSRGPLLGLSLAPFYVIRYKQIPRRLWQHQPRKAQPLDLSVFNVCVTFSLLRCVWGCVLLAVVLDCSPGEACELKRRPHFFPYRSRRIKLVVDCDHSRTLLRAEPTSIGCWRWIAY